MIGYLHYNTILFGIKYSQQLKEEGEQDETENFFES